MNSQRGFTLMELVTVMVILAILSVGAAAVLLSGGQEHIQVCREMSLSLRSLQNINMNEGVAPEFFFKTVQSSSGTLYFGVCRKVGIDSTCTKATYDDHASWLKASSSDNIKVTEANNYKVIQFDALGRVRNFDGKFVEQKELRYKVQGNNGGTCTVTVNREGGISWR